MPQIALEIVGEPITKGSKTGFFRFGRVCLVETSDLKRKGKKAGELTRWMKQIEGCARAAWRVRPLLIGPVFLHAVFRFARPKNHLSRKTKQPLPGYSAVHPSKDVDKLLRAVCDALTGVVYIDDRQVIGIHARKQWASLSESEGASLVIEWTREAEDERTV